MTKLKKITATLIHSEVTPKATSYAQVWGIDYNGNLTSKVNYSYGDQTLWTPWMDVWNKAPTNLIDIAACLQGKNRSLAKVWALDKNGVLHTCEQTALGGPDNFGTWSKWKSFLPDTPKLTSICAVSQLGTNTAGTNRGAQIWGVGFDGYLKSTYQDTSKLRWQSWTNNWMNAPQNIKTMTACKQNNGKVILWVLPENNLLYAIEQTEPGGSWTPKWTTDWRNPPFTFTAIGAVQQGGNRGAQFWGIHSGGILTSIFEQSPGTDWTNWTQASWSSCDPVNLTELAACQSWENLAAFLWALDNNGNVYFRQQKGRGEDWMNWEAWE